MRLGHRTMDQPTPPPKPPKPPAPKSSASAAPVANQPAFTPPATAAVVTDNPPSGLAKAKALYDQAFPVDSPRRRYGPAIIAGVVIVILLLAQCAVSSAGKKISEVSAAHTEAKRVESTGILVVKSNRPEATVTATRLASTDNPSATPAQGTLGQPLTYLPPGKYDITLHSAGWPDAHAQIDVPAGKTTETTINFKGGSLRLDSDPTGAIVRLGTADLGKTPLTIPLLPPGEVQLTFEYPSWPLVPLKVTVVEDKETPATVRLPHGKVVLESEPAGATVLANRSPIGKTPLAIDPVPAGPRKYAVQLKGFPAIEVSVTVVDAQEAKYHAVLGSFFPLLDPGALLRDVWIPDDNSKITTGFNATTGIYKPKNDVVKNIHREGLYNRWLNKVYKYSGTIKSYDSATGKIEFAENKSELARYRVIAHAPSGASFPKDATASVYGLLEFVEEPTWPGRVITLELTGAQFLP